jgi:hypothetical protein
MNYPASRQFRITLLLLILLEELSLVAYLAPATGPIFFILLALVFLALAIWRLPWAVWLVLIELIIGSKGYLFFYDFAGTRISLRIVLWSAVLLVWLGKTLIDLIREKKFKPELKNFIISLKTGEKRSLVLLAIFVLWGFINGLFITKNGLADTFLDFNGWLYFLLIFPLYSVFKKREDLDKLLPLILAAAVWLGLKTLTMGFVFSHASMESPAFRLYRWVRTSGVGEITQVKGGFYRIFFQSQIYGLISFLSFGAVLTSQIVRTKFSILLKTKNFWCAFSGASFFLAVILFSLSRSFWLGLFAGLLLLLPFLYLETRKLGENFLQKFAATASVFFASLIFGTALVVLTVTFPIPEPLGGFDTGSLLNARLDTGEAAAVSRWELLPKLWHKILEAPVLGSGFGTAITYQSSDPRQLASPNHGRYTTYAFEWGWLDIWLKLGIFGVAAYLLLIVQAIRATIRSADNGGCSSSFGFILISGLIAIAVTHFFSPYLNHPLGIGYLILMLTLANVSKNKLTTRS